jgi:hypothetical protein
MGLTFEKHENLKKRHLIINRLYHKKIFSIFLSDNSDLFLQIPQKIKKIESVKI